MDRLDRKNLTDTVFDVVLRGYDKRQVEERLRFLGAELTAAEDAYRASTQRVALLEAALEAALTQAQSPPSGEPAGEGNFGARVEKILKLAEDEAAEVRGQAEDLLRAAAADAEQMGRAARAAADQLVAQARTEAELLVATATEAAQQRERTSAHELHQLSRLQDEINGDLYRVKDLLDSLFGAGGAVTGVIRHRLRKDGAQPAQPARTV